MRWIKSVRARRFDSWVDQSNSENLIQINAGNRIWPSLSLVVQEGVDSMTCLLIHDLVEGAEVAIPMPRFGQDQGMDNPYRSILSSDETTAALIERHERFLLNLERAD